MRFMCDEMKEGLLAGKAYFRPLERGERKVVLEADDTILFISSLENDSNTTREDLSADWSDESSYNMKFQEVFNLLLDGEVAENNFGYLYEMDVRPRRSKLYESTGPNERHSRNIDINKLMWYKWRIVHKDEEEQVEGEEAEE